MKKILQVVSFFLFGIMIFSSCEGEKNGESPKQLTERIEVESESAVKNTDTVEVEEPIVIAKPKPPMPPQPDPMPPGPWPDPDPRPYPPTPEPVPIIIPPAPPPMPHPDPLHDFVEIDPSFPGGTAELMKFIKDNIQYPEISKELGDQGRVFVEFVVEKDGSLSNIDVIRGVSAALDKEAKRIVRAMPKWTPGEQKGEIVRSRARVPITFTLH